MAKKKAKKAKPKKKAAKPKKKAATKKKSARCAAKTKAGKQCKKYVTGKSKFCSSHKK